MNRKIHRAKYLILDILSAGVAWSLFYIFRKIYIESAKFGYKVPIEFGTNFFLGLIFVPLFWIVLYYVTGHYNTIYRKSRLIELWQTFSATIVGVVILFFALILDDTISSYIYYYKSCLALFLFHSFLSYIPRLLLTTATANRIHKGIIGFNTLLIGSQEEALKIYEKFESMPLSSGNSFIGFITIKNGNKKELNKRLNHLGDLNDIEKIIAEHKIEEVIIAVESNEHDKVELIINNLRRTNVIIKAIPSMYDIVRGMSNLSSIYGIALIMISHKLMPAFQENLKRMIDVAVSLFALLFLSPMYFVVAIGVKLSSKGPVFYSHERIGKYGKPFKIYKFRSMFVDAEKNGPSLASDNDKRITSFGLFMRKSRIDEFPQFYNVLIGDMSLVGPRPERQFFIDQIVKIAPHYYHLQKIRPGITSWGQVKYGYAEDVNQMVERLKFDMIYIENMSLYIDLKILIYTVLTVLKGSGK